MGVARTPMATICLKIGAILKNCPVNGAIKIQ
jgi:hypothetical protein